MPDCTNTFTTAEKDLLRQGLQKLISECDQQKDAVDKLPLNDQAKDYLKEYYGKRKNILVDLLIKINPTGDMPELPKFSSMLKDNEHS